jgi:transcriptional regulator GlxA family with amidase domain
MPINGYFTPFDIERIKSAIAYIEKHYSNNISAENLSLEVNMDIKQLQIGMQLLTGFTVHNYLLKIRIDNAAKTLQDFSTSIKTIAHTHGFSSHAHFSTEFKKQKGISPKKYRYQLLKNQ